MSGHYYLNGNWVIDFPKPLWFAGTVFNYERNTFYAPESISCLGPTTEPLYIVVSLIDSDNSLDHIVNGLGPLGKLGLANSSLFFGPNS